MQTARIINGQITIPISMRKKLNIKDGDKLAIIETDNGISIVHPNVLAFEEARKDFAGVAEELGLKTLDDVVKMIKEIRAEN
jgi:AbrB family looped-hinge helix DNA binding protein